MVRFFSSKLLDIKYKNFIVLLHDIVLIKFIKLVQLAFSSEGLTIN